MKKSKKIARMTFIVFLVFIGLTEVRWWSSEPEKPIEPEIKKEKVYIEYRNTAYKENAEEVVPIVSEDGTLWAVAGTTLHRPVEIPVNQNYEIGVYCFGEKTVFFHMGEEPVKFIVDFKTQEIIGVGIDYQTREEHDKEHGIEEELESESDSDSFYDSSLE